MSSFEWISWRIDGRLEGWKDAREENVRMEAPKDGRVEGQRSSGRNRLARRGKMPRLLYPHSPCFTRLIVLRQRVLVTTEGL